MKVYTIAQSLSPFEPAMPANRMIVDPMTVQEQEQLAASEGRILSKRMPAATQPEPGVFNLASAKAPKRA